MPKINPSLERFNNGELSPLLLGRVGSNEQVASIRQGGAQRLENMLPDVLGSLSNRGGTHFMAEAFNNDKRSRLIPFELSDRQTYILEFATDNEETPQSFVRIFTPTGLFLDSESNPVTVEIPYNNEDFATIQYAQSTASIFFAHPDYPVGELNLSGDTPETLTWTYSVVEFSDGGYQTENSDEDALLAPSNTSGDNRAITASGTLDGEPFAPFVATDVGRQIRIKHTDQWGWATITEFTSSTVVRVNIGSNFGATGTSSEWRLGAWSETTGYPATITFADAALWLAGTNADPQTIWKSVRNDFFTFSPTVLEDGQVTDAEGFSYEISSANVSRINYLIYARHMFIGTNSGIWRLTTPETQPFTPTNISFRNSSGISTSRFQPVIADNDVMFIQKQGRKLYSLAYDLNNDDFVGREKSINASHILQQGAVAIAYQEQPTSIIWVVRADGELVGFTYDTTNGTEAWHRHIVGGSFRGGKALVESAAVLPTTDLDELWVCVRRTINGVDKRYIERLDNGYRTKEYQEQAFHVDSGISYDVPYAITSITTGAATTVTAAGHDFVVGDDIRFIGIVGVTLQDADINRHPYIVTQINGDSFTIDIDTTNYTPYIIGGEARKFVQNLSGLEHLEGEEVAITVDGATQVRETVENGSISLVAPATIVHVGLPYRSLLETMPVAFVLGNLGSTEIRKKKIVRATLNIFETLGMSYGTRETNLNAINFRRGDDFMDAAIPLTSGLFDVKMPAGYTASESIFIVQDSPLPATLLAITPEITIEG